MDTILQTTEWQGLIWILLAVVMIKELRKHGKEIFDDELTSFDKDRLLRLAYTFVFPVVVFFHECGHAAATVWAGGIVKEFHYGAWIGYVVPVGHFTALQDLIITLAGNVVQILFGFLFLIFALLSRSPAVVALWVYSGILSIGGTVIIYTLLSVLTGDGDWAMIYRTPLKDAFDMVLGSHILLAVFIIYLVNGGAPKAWFYKRTHPAWREKLSLLKEKLKTDSSRENQLQLARHYALGLDLGEARKILDKLLQVGIDKAEFKVILLKAYLEAQANRPSKAIALCQQILDRNEDPLVLCQAFCFYGKLLPQVPRTENALGKARQYLDKAIELAPDHGDPYFYKAVNLANSGDIEGAQEILSNLLSEAESLVWFNYDLAEEVLPELNALTSGKNKARG